METPEVSDIELGRRYPVLQYFEAKHLPEPLRSVSEKFGSLARDMATVLPSGAETAAGLRKLLEAKDCFVRVMLSK